MIKTSLVSNNVLQKTERSTGNPPAPPTKGPSPHPQPRWDTCINMLHKLLLSGKLIHKQFINKAHTSGETRLEQFLIHQLQLWPEDYQQARATSAPTLWVGDMSPSCQDTVNIGTIFAPHKSPWDIWRFIWVFSPFVEGNHHKLFQVKAFFRGDRWKTHPGGSADRLEG